MKPPQFRLILQLNSLFSPPKTPQSQRVPLGCLVISVTLILPTHNPSSHLCPHPACWVVIRVFLDILLILEHKTIYVIVISFLLSKKKNDADVLVRIALLV